LLAGSVGEGGPHPTGTGNQDRPAAQRNTRLKPVDSASGEARAGGGAAGSGTPTGGDRDLEEAVQAAVEPRVGGRHPECVSDLVEDLVLADQCALEAGGHPQQVDDGRLAGDKPEVAGQPGRPSRTRKAQRDGRC